MKIIFYNFLWNIKSFSKTVEEFDNIISNGNIVIVKFGAEWCGPCKTFHTVLKSLEQTLITENIKNVVICEVDVAIDYPDQDIEYIDQNTLVDKLKPILSKIEALQSTARTGAQIKNGVNIALVGIPNAGKSSLLNAMLGYDRAIVTDVAGTTRDTLNETYQFNGIKFNIIDTAGLHSTDNIVEKIGIQRTLDAIKDVDYSGRY